LPEGRERYLRVYGRDLAREKNAPESKITVRGWEKGNHLGSCGQKGGRRGGGGMSGGQKR